MIGQEATNRLRQRLVSTPLGQGLLRAKLQLAYPESGHAIYLARAIQGWLSDPEADRLYKLAKNNTPEINPVVVEIGSWKGKSSSVIAAGLRGKQNARLFCLDPFGIDENPEYQERYYSSLLETENDVLAVFKRNLQQCGVASIATPIKGYSFEIIDGWTTPIDFLFIDANHEYEAVLRDFVLWSPLVKVGGIVALHDTGHWQGPTRVMQEKLISPNYSEVQSVDTLAWARKNEP